MVGGRGRLGGWRSAALSWLRARQRTPLTLSPWDEERKDEPICLERRPTDISIQPGAQLLQAAT